jgi:hypothetical protein
MLYSTPSTSSPEKDSIRSSFGVRDPFVRDPGVLREGEHPVLPFRPHKAAVEAIDVLLQVPAVCDGPLIRHKPGDGAFAPAPIGNSVEVRRICIPMEEPGLTTPLSPVFLLHLKQVGKLAFQVIPQRPSLIIKAHGISSSI